ncbi:hypothetical protein B0H19DRAFT_1269213 [Mycena capillaripes]|nr:hypothetical protein B0H19DRAFT_1269213 [Mycena capillaripes]
MPLACRIDASDPPSGLRSTHHNRPPRTLSTTEQRHPRRSTLSTQLAMPMPFSAIRRLLPSIIVATLIGLASSLADVLSLRPAAFFSFTPTRLPLYSPGVRANYDFPEPSTHFFPLISVSPP